MSYFIGNDDENPMDTFLELIKQEAFSYKDTWDRESTFYGPVKNNLPEGFGVNYTSDTGIKLFCQGHFSEGFLNAGRVIGIHLDEEIVDFNEGIFSKGHQ